MDPAPDAPEIAAHADVSPADAFPVGVGPARRLGCLRRVAGGSLVALALVWLAGPSCARALPQVLIEREPPQAADALVVLAGDHRGGRVDAAVALWEAGWVSEGPFVVAGGQLYGEVTWASVMRARALAQGIPAERIRLQAESRTTEEDARRCAALLGLRPGQRVILVTSAWHSGRALGHFQAAFGPDVQVLSCPAPDPAPEWWRDPEATRALTMELLKRLWPGEGG